MIVISEQNLISTTITRRVDEKLFFTNFFIANSLDLTELMTNTDIVCLLFSPRHQLTIRCAIFSSDDNDNNDYEK